MIEETFTYSVSFVPSDVYENPISSHRRQIGLFFHMFHVKLGDSLDILRVIFAGFVVVIDIISV